MVNILYILVAQRVIKKHEAQPIQFEGSLLQIQMLYSNSRPAQVLGPKEANVLLLKVISTTDLLC